MTDEPTWWRDDDELLAELGEAMRAGRDVPETFVESGKAVFVWRTVDAELAELLVDSATAEPELSGMRGDAHGAGQSALARALRFVAGGVTIELEIHPDAIRGLVVPPQPGTISVRDAGGVVNAFPIDDVGWFEVRPVPDSRFRLLVKPDAGGSVVTDWIVV